MITLEKTDLRARYPYGSQGYAYDVPSPSPWRYAELPLDSPFEWVVGIDRHGWMTIRLELKGATHRQALRLRVGDRMNYLIARLTPCPPQGSLKMDGRVMLLRYWLHDERATA